jgi:hypothetical protein
MQIEKFDEEFSDSKVYGFMVYNRSGNSLPKGMISSYKVIQYDNNAVHIQWSLQSGSQGADSSDHYNFSMPVSTFERGKAMVDMYASMVHNYIYEQDNVL